MNERLPFPLNAGLARGLLLIAATFLAYWPAWNGQPVWDDDLNLAKPELWTTADFAPLWIKPGATPQYYPLTYSVFWMEHQLWGRSTLGFHLFTILLHVFSALLIVRILRRLRIPGAWLAAGIFALHPIQVESVAWMTELKNTLSGVFFLGAGLAYLRFDYKKEKSYYAAALILFILGLLAKSVIVILPAALLAVVWWQRGNIEWKRDVTPLLPFFAIGIISGVFTALFESRFVGAAGNDFNFTFIERCLIAGRAVWFYLYKLFWPVNLNFIYPRWDIDASAMWQYLFPATLLLTTALFWGLRNRSRAPLATLLYFCIALFPALGFFNVNFFRVSFVADHFQYLACIGPITAAAACIVKGADRLGEKIGLPVQMPACFLLLSLLFLLSWKQSDRYAFAETLYRTTIRENPECWMAHNNLGLILADKGRADEAMAHYQKALDLKPDYGDAHYNLGLLLADKGRTDDALVHYQMALDRDPNDVSILNNLGLLLADKGRKDEAMAHYQKALEIKPDNAAVHYNLAILLGDRGRTGEAMTHYRKVLELDPNHFGACNNLGGLLVKTGQTDEAIALYRKALEIKPSAMNALQNYVVALAQKGLMTEAASVLQRAHEAALSAGDEARAEAIAKIFTNLYETFALPRGDTNTEER